MIVDVKVVVAEDDRLVVTVDVADVEMVVGVVDAVDDIEVVADELPDVVAVVV